MSETLRGPGGPHVTSASPRAIILILSAPIPKLLRAALADRYELHEELGARN